MKPSVMKLVVDSNVLFAAVVRRGKSLEVIKSKRVELMSPSFSLDEIREHKLEVMKKTGFTEEELELFIELLKNEITFVPLKQYIKYLEKAMHLSVDSDDVDFFALSLQHDKIPFGLMTHILKCRKRSKYLLRQNYLKR